MSSVTQVHRAVGSWDITFTGLPLHVIEQLDELGHIAITESREDGPAIADSLLDSARYVGVVRGRRKEAAEFDFTLKGAGLAWWLGTEDNLGAVYETPQPFSNATLSTVITNLLPDSIQPGTLTNTGLPTYTGTHQWQTPREAIDYVCDTIGATWRVNNDGTLDAGPQATVFSSGRALIVRREQDAGEDMTLRAFPGPADTERDREGFTTRAIVLGRLEESSVVEGTADISPGLNPFLDLFGNPVAMTRLVSETTTDGPNAAARAQIVVDQYSRPQRVVNLNTGDYDMRGVIEVGDFVWVYDPDAGLVDLANEVQFRGQRYNPVTEQVTSMTWPVTAGMGVYYRSRAGVWIDLSDWVVTSSSTTSIEVGAQDRALIDSGSNPVGRVPQPDTSVPNTPTFTTPFTQSLFLNAAGLSRSQVQVRWVAPTQNTDGTAFVDGSHYEIRYRATGVSAPDWAIQFVPIDQVTFLLQDLDPGTEYEFQIRVLDTASPPNASAWSASHLMTTNLDVIPPPTPAAPTVAGSRIAVQVKHTLGVSTGGTFNLPLDLEHLEVHVGTTSGFTPSDTTRVGKIIATWGLIQGQIPVVETFAVDATTQVWVKVIAVDVGGNKSGPSAAASVTAQLIDSAHISDLTATKITAGTLSATIALSGLFRTAVSGARFEAGVNGTLNGHRLYRPSGTLALYGQASTGDLISYRPDGTTRAFHLVASTGDVILYRADGSTPALKLTGSTGDIYFTGEMRTAESGLRWVINPANTAFDQIRAYPDVGSNFSQITAVPFGSDRTMISVKSSTDAAGASGLVAATHQWAEIVFGSGSAINRVGVDANQILLLADRAGADVHIEAAAGNYMQLNADARMYVQARYSALQTGNSALYLHLYQKAAGVVSNAWTAGGSLSFPRLWFVDVEAAVGGDAALESPSTTGYTVRYQSNLHAGAWWIHLQSVGQIGTG